MQFIPKDKLSYNIFYYKFFGDPYYDESICVHLNIKNLTSYVYTNSYLYMGGVTINNVLLYNRKFIKNFNKKINENKIKL